MTQPIIECAGLSKTFESAATRVHVLCEVDFSVAGGEKVAIMGPSGSGKSTLLGIMGLLIDPDTGTIRTKGTVVDNDPRRRAKLRNEFFGFVDQEFAIINEESALDNVLIPLEFANPRPSRRERRERAEACLAAVALEGVGRRLGKRFSGGERQRIAVARALINHPDVILADEPTASLDRKTAGSILDLLFKPDRGSSLVVATHDPAVADRCDRIITIEEGKLRGDL